MECHLLFISAGSRHVENDFLSLAGSGRRGADRAFTGSQRRRANSRGGMAAAFREVEADDLVRMAWVGFCGAGARLLCSRRGSSSDFTQLRRILGRRWTDLHRSGRVGFAAPVAARRIIQSA